MSKGLSDLDEELNENIDFLEEEETNHKPKTTPSELPKKFDFSHNHKKILVVAVILIMIILIIVWLTHSPKHTNSSAIIAPISKNNKIDLNNNLKSNNHILKKERDLHQSTDQESKVQQDLKPNNRNGTDIVYENSNINQNKQEVAPTNLTLNNIDKKQDIMNNDINNTSVLPNENQHKSIEQSLEQNLEPTPITSVLPSNPGSTTNLSPNSISSELPPSNNLTWQEIKKSIIDNKANATKPNLENNIPVGEFQKSSNNQILLSQNYNQNHAMQENIRELQSTVASITANLTNNTSQIKELQNNLQEIFNAINKVDTKLINLTNTVDKLSKVDTKILNLTNAVDNLSADIKNVKKYVQDDDIDLTTNLKLSESDLFSNSPEYVVHAVIPGRAWLKSTSGQIITVTEGDLLGDYGKIAMIDATNNIVRTSSGVVFR